MLNNSWILSGILGGITTWFILSHLGKKPKVRTQGYEIKSKKYYLFTAFVQVALVVFLIFVGIIYPPKTKQDPENFKYLLIIIISFSLGALYFFIEYFGSRGRFTSEDIYFSSLWKGTRKELWNDLCEVSTQSGDIKMTFTTGTTININYMQIGFHEVMDLIHFKQLNLQPELLEFIETEKKFCRKLLASEYKDLAPVTKEDLQEQVLLLEDGGEEYFFSAIPLLFSEKSNEFNYRLIWLPTEELYGSYDPENAILRVFPNCNWTDIITQPNYYINALNQPRNRPGLIVFSSDYDWKNNRQFEVI